MRLTQLALTQAWNTFYLNALPTENLSVLTFVAPRSCLATYSVLKELVEEVWQHHFVERFANHGGLRGY